MSKLKNNIHYRLNILMTELRNDASSIIENSDSEYTNNVNGEMDFEASDVKELDESFNDTLEDISNKVGKKWTGKGAKRKAEELLEIERQKFNIKINSIKNEYMPEDGKELSLPTIDEYQARVNNKIKSFKDYNEEFEKLNNQFTEGTKVTSALIRQMQFTALSYVVSQVVPSTVNLEVYREKTVDASIAGRQETSFDMLDPMSSYSELKMAEVYEHTSKRTLQAEQSANYWKIGATVAGAVALAALTYFVPVIAGYTAPTIGTILTGAGIGASIGGLVGDYKGKEITTEAEAENIKEQADAQAQIKFLNQVYSMAKTYVQAYRKYDIKVVQERARLGSKSAQHTMGDLGYSLMSEIDIETNLAEGIGKYDSGLYHDQVAFTRAEGLNVSELQGINKVGQMISQDIDLSELSYGNKLAKKLYGGESSGKKTADILDSIAETIKKMISHKANVNISEANNIALLPALIYGTDNPYGRIDQLGGKTLDSLNSMFSPSNIGEDLFLMEALQPKSYIEYAETKKEGILGGNISNLNKLLDHTKGKSGGSYYKFYQIINDLTKEKLPAGAIETLYEYSNGKGIKITRERYSKSGKGYKKDDNGEYVGVRDNNGKMTYEKRTEENESYIGAKDSMSIGSQEDLRDQINKTAKDNTSANEKLQNTLDDMHISVGKSWERTISNMEIKQMNLFSKMSNSSMMYNKICEAISKGTKDLMEWLTKQGYKGEYGDRFGLMTKGAIEKYLLSKYGIDVNEYDNRNLRKGDKEQGTSYQARILRYVANAEYNSEGSDIKWKDLDAKKREGLINTEYSNFKIFEDNYSKDFYKKEIQINGGASIEDNSKKDIVFNEEKDSIIRNIPLEKSNTIKVAEVNERNSILNNKIGALLEVASMGISSLNTKKNEKKQNFVLNMQGDSTNKFYTLNVS